MNIVDSSCWLEYFGGTNVGEQVRVRSIEIAKGEFQEVTDKVVRPTWFAARWSPAPPTKKKALRRGPMEIRGIEPRSCDVVL